MEWRDDNYYVLDSAPAGWYIVASDYRDDWTLWQAAIAHSEASHADEVRKLKEEIARLTISSQMYKDCAEQNTANLSEAHKQLAMKDDALKEIASFTQSTNLLWWQVEARKALSDTPTQVSEWERKQLEPLRKEAADWRAACHADRDRHYAETVLLQAKIAELEGMAARQADALDAIAYPVKHLSVWAKYQPRMADEVVCAEIAKDALAASAETVAAWRAKETEPLRGEVAMMRNQIALIAENCPNTEYDPDCTGTGNADDAYDHGANMARSTIGSQLRELLDANTQATSLAYEQEVEKRGAVKALEVLKNRLAENDESAMWNIEDMLRATNKKGSE